jgi:hypothetical protein
MDVVDDLVLGKGEDRVYLKMRSLDLGGEFEGGFEDYVNKIKKHVEELKNGSR